VTCNVTCNNCNGEYAQHCNYPYTLSTCLAKVVIDETCLPSVGTVGCIVNCGPTCQLVCDSCSRDTDPMYQGHPKCDASSCR
ncbi:5787_t:CDS:1, partial [Gigaspora rosea]